MDTASFDRSRVIARQRLLATWADGAFRGQLSASALSTATASMAFSMAARAEGRDDELKAKYRRLAGRGSTWLRENQNADGGWGDTTTSPSNISTTTLCWAALGQTPSPADATVSKAEAWLTERAGDLTPERLAAVIRARYGKDHTFSVPILTTCAIGGRLGSPRDAWRLVPQLPFELAACPHQWFHRLGMPMVSYALPALIAIGQVRHHFRPTRNPITRAARAAARGRTLRILERIQPTTGGYLEAAPLTSFVVMSLLAMGLDEHPVARNGLRFLAESVRDDGSWPIDTNLDTWTTTLATGALAGPTGPGLAPDVRTRTLDWLLAQQYTEVHPYTHARPGGWAWTDLPGGVPDADDTPGALLAVRHLAADKDRERARAAGIAGITWLCDLQNRDGGIPTFCRGFGKLPFDRSSPDLTAHTIRAFDAWRDELPEPLRARADRAARRGLAYLLRVQRADGAWVPLWFGNQAEPAEENPLYGTARVLPALRTSLAANDSQVAAAANRAARWIKSLQHADGGFGAAPDVPPSIEETALATEALATDALIRGVADEARDDVVRNGAQWLVAATDHGAHFPAAPVGLYFAKLWYSEELYPVTFTVAAWEAAARCLAPRDEEGSVSCAQT